VSWRVARSRELVDGGFTVAVVARVLQVSRQAIYRVPKPRRPTDAAKRPPAGEVETAIIEVAQDNPTDGYRLVTAWVRRRLGRPVNRKRVLRVMRERKLIQRRRTEPRRRRPGFFRVERPGQLWHLDMTSVWVAEHGWCYLNAIIDCCTREIVGWDLTIRCRATEAITVIERAVAEHGIKPGMLTLGTDNGSAFTARATRLVLSALGVAHRRGGYRDPESQAFIESWFRYLKERCVWRHEFETLDQAREVIAAYIDHYHDRPHSRLNYLTPTEVRQTWDDATGPLQTSRPEPSTPTGSAPPRNPSYRPQALTFKGHRKQALILEGDRADALISSEPGKALAQAVALGRLRHRRDAHREDPEASPGRNRSRRRDRRDCGWPSAQAQASPQRCGRRPSCPAHGGCERG
jgi:putative transposase